MNRTFIEVPIFTRKWYDLGLTDTDLQNLQIQLLKDPKSGDAIKGTDGLRKIRVSLANKGKRGGARVLYIDIDVKEKIYLINVYSKKEKDDITEDEKKAINSLIKILKEE